MIAAHLAAVKGLLSAARPSMRVFTEPPQSPDLLADTAFPYVVLYIDSGARSTDRYAVAPHRADFQVQTTVVALSEAQANACRADVVAALALASPVVAGRVVSRISHTSQNMPYRDTDVPGKVIFTAADHWSFTSRAA